MNTNACQTLEEERSQKKWSREDSKDVRDLMVVLTRFSRKVADAKGTEDELLNFIHWRVQDAYDLGWKDGKESGFKEAKKAERKQWNARIDDTFTPLLVSTVEFYTSQCKTLTELVEYYKKRARITTILIYIKTKLIDILSRKRAKVKK